MAIDHFVRQPERDAEFADFILEQFAQRFEQLQVERFRQAADIVVTLDGVGPAWDAAWAAAWDAARAAAWDAARDAAWAAAWTAAGLLVRDLIGQHGLTQGHYDLLTQVWRTAIGPIHPDDAPIAGDPA